MSKGISGKDFLNRVTKVLTSDLQRWEWNSEQQRIERGGEQCWCIGVRFTGTGQCVEIKHLDAMGRFRVLNEIGSMGATHRLEGMLNGLVRNARGNMVEPGTPEEPTATC